MANRILKLILAAAVVIELGLTLGGFVVPERLMAAFKVGVSADMLFLGNVLAWLLLAITLVCGLALKWVMANKEAGWTLSILLGLWWIGIGIGIYVGFGIIDNLFLDSLKGAIIVVAAWQSRPVV